MTRKQDAIDLLEEAPDDAAFAAYMITKEGHLNGVQRVGQGDPKRLGQMQLALLAAHIRGVTEHLDSDRTPADTADLALQTLAEFESDETPGGGATHKWGDLD
jgi:hypothetical protein